MLLSRPRVDGLCHTPPVRELPGSNPGSVVVARPIVGLSLDPVLCEGVSFRACAEEIGLLVADEFFRLRIETEFPV